MTRTLVVGLDAATWTVVEPLRREGRLPVLDDLVERGVSGTMVSTMPPMTPLSWTSMATGVNPGKHGIYDFVAQDRQTYRITPTEYAEMPRPAVWDLLNAAGQTAGVVNFPMAHPPEQIDDFFVSGFPTSETADIAHPSEVRSHIEETGFRIHVDAPKDDRERYLEELISLTDSQCDLTLDLVDRYDPDLLWTVFMGLDWAQHYLWEATVDGCAAVASLYEHIDGVVGRLINDLEDPTVLLVSDHGAGPIESEIHLNSLLEEWGYLTRGGADRSVADRATDLLFESAWWVWERLPPSVQRVVRRYLIDSVVAKAREAVGAGQYGMHTEIDWERTEAFSYGAMGRLFIHTAESYPEGTVTAEEYDSLRTELIDRLKGLSHPETGEALVDWAVSGESVYDGPLDDRAPDILFATANWEHMVYCDFDEEWIHPPRKRFADHHPEGLYVLAGDGVATGERDAEVIDVAPTLLHHHGLPILEGMDGTAMTDVLTTDKPVETVEDYEKTDRVDSGEQSDEVIDRLEDLGYL